MVGNLITATINSPFPNTLTSHNAIDLDSLSLILCINTKRPNIGLLQLKRLFSSDANGPA